MFTRNGSMGRALERMISIHDDIRHERIVEGRFLSNELVCHSEVLEESSR